MPVDAGGRRGDLTRVWGVGSGFGKWMQTSYSDAFTSAVKGKKGFTFATYDHVYIDVNNVLHVAAHHTKNEDAFFKKLFALLDLTMRRTRPQYTVTLALDGPAQRGSPAPAEDWAHPRKHARAEDRPRAGVLRRNQTA